MLPERGDRRAGAGDRRRGLRRPARSSAHAGAPAEGRPRQDFDPGACRPVPRLHRGGAQNAAGACRRLSGDGGVARLPEIASAAAGAAPSPKASAPRTWRPRWRSGCGGSKRSGRWPSNCSTGRSSAARFSSAASRSRSPRSSGRNGRRRSTTCCRPMPGSGKNRRGPSCACPSARCGRSPKRAKRSKGWSAIAATGVPLDQYLIAYMVEPALRGDGARLELCGDARTGARGPSRSASARGFHAALSSASGRTPHSGTRTKGEVRNRRCQTGRHQTGRRTREAKWQMLRRCV